MQTAKAINTMISFFIEIAMLIALGICGYQMSTAKWLQLILAIALPLLAVIIWGVWAAPRSKNRLQRPSLTLFKLVLFTITAVLLYTTGHLPAAIVFGVSAYINEVLAVKWEK